MNKELLNKPPASEHIKTRDKMGMALSYVEGFYCIDVANEIFGHANWNREFVGQGLQLVYEKEFTKNNKTRYDVAYLCTYEVRVGDACCSQDVGYGSGFSYLSFADAHESAAKEAVTDALKRCLRSFGNAFGNSLYDKVWLQETNGGQNQEPSKPEPEPNRNPKNKEIFKTLALAQLTSYNNANKTQHKFLQSKKEGAAFVDAVIERRMKEIVDICNDKGWESPLPTMQDDSTGWLVIKSILEQNGADELVLLLNTIREK